MPRIRRRLGVVAPQLHPLAFAPLNPFNEPASRVPGIEKDDDIAGAHRSPRTYRKNVVAIDQGGLHGRSLDHDVPHK